MRGVADRPVHTGLVTKFLIGAAAFVVSAAVGVGALVIWAIVILLLRRHDPHAGIGAFAGGLTDGVLLIVPLVCGAVGSFYALRKYSRDTRG